MRSAPEPGQIRNMSSILQSVAGFAESLSPMRRLYARSAVSTSKKLARGRFYKFVVKRLVGPFIKYDLDLDQAVPHRLRCVKFENGLTGSAALPLL